MPVADHGKSPVWFVFHCPNKLQSWPIGLRKIFIDYFFFQADQWDYTECLSIFNRFASSEESFRTFFGKCVAFRHRWIFKWLILNSSRLARLTFDFYVRGLWKSPVINSTEFGEIDRNSQQLVLVSPWIYFSALINNIFLLSNIYLDCGLDSRLVRLRNGKRAACNHRITDARVRLLRLRSADVFPVIACDDRKYVCASQARGCLAPKKRKSCKRW